MQNEQKNEYVVWAELSEEQQQTVEKLQNTMTEDALWECVIQFQQYLFQTASGLPFHYEIKRGKSGKLNRELLIDRREGSKSLTWSSFRSAFFNLMQEPPEDGLILSRLVDTFFSRISPTMQLPPKHHSIAYVLPWAEGLHWQSRSSGCSNS